MCTKETTDSHTHKKEARVIEKLKRRAVTDRRGEPLKFFTWIQLLLMIAKKSCSRVSEEGRLKPIESQKCFCGITCKSRR